MRLIEGDEEPELETESSFVSDTDNDGFSEMESVTLGESLDDGVVEEESLRDVVTDSCCVGEGDGVYDTKGELLSDPYVREGVAVSVVSDVS